MKSIFVFLHNLMAVNLPGCLSRVKCWILCRAGMDIGKNVHLSYGVVCFGNSVVLGDNVWFSEGSMISSGYTKDQTLINVGRDCDFGPEVLLCCGTHEIGGPGRRAGKGSLLPIKIGDGCWVGTRVVILGGVELGSGSVVAAGSVLKPGVYPPNVLLAGTPASIKKSL